MEENTSEQNEKIKYPKGIFFILATEFGERFCYYGMRAVLVLYLHYVLQFDEDVATQRYHLYTGLCYFFPLIGGILSDTYLGKFKTIFFLALVYISGIILLTISAASAQIPGYPAALLSMLALLIIALGTGGIKPCVSALGGDQFVLPQQAKQLERFFSVFYFTINSGSLLSTFMTPIFRKDVKCLGQDACYPLAFGFPGAIMIAAVFLFVLGKPLYKIVMPEKNMLLIVCKCILHALRRKYKTKKKDRVKSHWLDYSDDKYDATTIGDIKQLFRVLVLFLPLPLFWALFEQQGSRWIFQATSMDGRIPGTSFVIYPDQMQLLNPLMVLILIPLFQYTLYPAMGKCGLDKAVIKMTIGGFLASVAFIISAVVDWTLESGPICILWMVPQYIIITIAEVMFSVPGLEFGYTSAPVSMKSAVSAAWQLTTAFGNLLVVLIAKVSIVKNQGYEFLLFAILMDLTMIIFAVLAYRYTVLQRHAAPTNEATSDESPVDTTALSN